MDRDLSQWVPQVGQDVIGADGEKVGEIDGVEREYFIVRKGFFFPQDHYIPLTAVSSYDDDKVYLNVTKDEALEQDWSNPPVAGYDTTVADADVSAANTTLSTTDAGYAEGDRLAGMDTDVTERDSLRVPVHEEELTATTRPVERGQVRVTKDVVAEEQQLDVPVTEEHAHVTRRTVDRDVTADDTAFQEGTIEVPLRGEEVDVEKRARVVEEVDIEKQAETGTRRVGDTVRREEVHVEGDDVIPHTDTDVNGNPIR
jgi:uncharacterized protein (TIGR02271 family)